MRVELGLDEGARRLDDHLLFFGQSEIHHALPLSDVRGPAASGRGSAAWASAIGRSRASTSGAAGRSCPPSCRHAGTSAPPSPPPRRPLQDPDEDVQPLFVRASTCTVPVSRSPSFASPRCRIWRLGGVVAVPARHIVHLRPDQPQEVVRRSPRRRTDSGFRSCGRCSRSSPAAPASAPSPGARAVSCRIARGSASGQPLRHARAAPCPRPSSRSFSARRKPIRFWSRMRSSSRMPYMPRLRVGLARDQVHQLVVELGHVHQLGPGPFQAGPNCAMKCFIPASPPAMR